MNFEDGSTELEKLLNEVDSPRPAFWFPLVVLASAWYTTTWFAWWLGTPSPEGNTGHIEAYVHFGAMTGSILVMLQAGPSGMMPTIGRWFWALIAVSSVALFLIAIFGPGSLFRNVDLSQFNLLSGHRQNQAFFFQFLWSMLAVILTFVSIWSVLSVVFVSVRFCGISEQLVSKRARGIRLGIASFCTFLLLPTLYILRENYLVSPTEPANSLAYSYWLIQVVVATGFLWCTCLLMTRFKRQSARLGVGLFILWFTLLLLWANRNELRHVVSGALDSALLCLFGFLMHWSAVMGSLYFDRKMPATEHAVERFQPGRRPNEISSSPLQQSSGTPLAMWWYVAGWLTFLFVALIATRFPSVYEPITLITPRGNQWDRASQVARLWQFSTQEAGANAADKAVAICKVPTTGSETYWRLVVPLETAVLPEFHKVLISITQFNVLVFVSTSSPNTDEDRLLQLHEMGYLICGAHSMKFFYRDPDAAMKFAGQIGAFRIKDSAIELDDAAALLQHRFNLSFTNCTFEPSALNALVAANISLEFIKCPNLDQRKLALVNSSANRASITFQTAQSSPALQRENELLGVLVNRAISLNRNFSRAQYLEALSETDEDLARWLDAPEKLPKNLTRLYMATDELGCLSGWVDDSTWRPDHKRTLRLREVFAKSRLRWLRAIPSGYLVKHRSEAEDFLANVQELEHLDIDPPHGISPWVLSWISEQPLQTVILRGSAGSILDNVLHMPTLRRLAIPYHQLAALEKQLASLESQRPDLDIVVYFRDSDIVRFLGRLYFVEFDDSVSRLLARTGSFSGVTIRFCEGLPFAEHFGTPREQAEVTPLTADDVKRKISNWIR